MRLPACSAHRIGRSSDIDVARLAAEGLSNAEIGAKLFISAGTAKVHLHHIYVKLNLANRAQLTAEVTRRDERRLGQ